MSEIDRLRAERDALAAQLFAEKLGHRFAQSPYLKANVRAPADMLQARFGGSFKMEDGRVVGTDAAGHTIMSRSRLGEVAEFDEAMEILLGSYEHRATIVGPVEGARGQAWEPAARPQMTRAAFDRLQPGAALEFITARGVVVD